MPRSRSLRNCRISFTSRALKSTIEGPFVDERASNNEFGLSTKNVNARRGRNIVPSSSREAERAGGNISAMRDQFIGHGPSIHNSCRLGRKSVLVALASVIFFDEDNFLKKLPRASKHCQDVRYIFSVS